MPFKIVKKPSAPKSKMKMVTVEKSRKNELKKLLEETPEGEDRDLRETKTDKEVQQDIEKAEEAVKQAESYKESYGSTIQWGEQTYDLGTTQGWKNYQQAVREAKSEVSSYKRSLFEQRMGTLQKQAPEPKTAQISYSQTEVGPPKVATPDDAARLRAEGYELPEDKTIYISPSGEVYYYEEEPTEPRKTLSMHLWEASKRFEESDTAKLFGVVPYSEKGARQIGAVIVGSAERTATDLFGFIPGEQPLEIMPDEQRFDWRGLGFDDLPKGKLFAARVTGKVTEQALGFGVYAAAGWAGASVIGASGALVSKVPVLGPALGSSGVTTLFQATGAALTLPIAFSEGTKVIELFKSGKPHWEIAAEIEIEASKLFGTAYGFSRGFSYGQQLPAKVERLIRGGTTIPKEAIVPENVLTGEGRFPRFKSEPYEPTAEGYKQFAEKYTPPELRITAEGIPSYHVTTSPIRGDFVTQPGLRSGTLRYDDILGRFVGRGEYGYFVAPGASSHFGRLGEAGYGLTPGLPNPFGGEAKILLGEYAGVEVTGLSKSSAELANILKAAEGSGKLFMPAEQMSEAQAVLSPGTEMVSVPGRFYTDIGGKTIKIDRYLPKILADVLGVEGSAMSVETFMAKQAAGASSLVGEQPTTYLPVLSSKPGVSESKIIDRVTASKPSKPSGISGVVSSVLGEPSSISPSIVSVSGVTESGAPSRGGPSKTTPEPSIVPSESKPTVTSVTGTPSRGTPSKTPPIYTPTVTRRTPSKTTYKPPDLFGKKKQRRVQAVDILGSRGYGYRVIEPADIIGTSKRGKAPDIFGEKKKGEIPNIFGPSKK